MRDKDLRGTILYGAGLSAAAALAYVFNAVMGRQLSASDFGTFGALLAVLLTLSGPSTALFGGGAMSAARRGTIPRIPWIGALLAVAVAATITALLPLPSGSRAVLWFVEATSVWFVTSWNRGLLIGLGRLGLVGGTIGLEAICRLVFAVALIRRGWGLNGAAAGLALGMTSAALVSWLLLPRRRGRGERVSNDVWLVIVGLLFLGLVQFPDVITIRLLDGHQAGLYNAISGIARVVLYAQAPAVAYAIRRGAVAGLRSAIRRSLPLALAPGVLTLIVIQVIPSRALSITYGGHYSGGVTVLRILAVAMALSGLETVLISACMGAGRVSWVRPMSILSVLGVGAVFAFGHSLLKVAIANLIVQALLLVGAALLARSPRETAQTEASVLILNWRDTRHPQGGGSEVFVESIARELVEKGWGVTIFCADHGLAPRDEERNGVRFIRRGSWWSVYPRAALLHLFHRLGPHDVVIDVQNAIPFFSALYCRRPVIVLVHHVHKEQWEMIMGRRMARAGWWVESRLAPLLHRRLRYLTVSEATKHELISLGVDAERISIVHNGSPDILDRAGAPRASEPTIAYLGRLVPHKRIELILEAASELRSEFRSLHVEIVGRGAWERNLRERARGLGVEDIVRFQGFVDEETKFRIIKEAWTMALPSVKEGWGLVVVEAAALEVPTVAYRVGGLQECIVSGKTGILVDDYREFVDALRTLLSSSNLRDRMGEEARVRAITYSWTASGDAVDDLLRGEIARRSQLIPDLGASEAGLEWTTLTVPGVVSSDT